MSTVAKIFLWIAIALVVLIGFASYWGKGVWDKITFSKPVPKSLSLNGLTLADLADIALTGKSKTVDVTVGMNIKNDNSFPIPFTLIVELSYKGTDIFQTDKISGTIPANSTYPVLAPAKITLSKAGAGFVSEKIRGGHPKIDYVLDLSLFGIHIPSSIVPSLTDSFIW